MATCAASHDNPVEHNSRRSPKSVMGSTNKPEGAAGRDETAPRAAADGSPEDLPQRVPRSAPEYLSLYPVAAAYVRPNRFGASFAVARKWLMYMAPAVPPNNLTVEERRECQIPACFDHHHENALQDNASHQPYERNDWPTPVEARCDNSFSAAPALEYLGQKTAARLCMPAQQRKHSRGSTPLRSRRPPITATHERYSQRFQIDCAPIDRPEHV